MFERLLDKTHVPTCDALTAYCGKSGELFTALHAYLTVACGTTREIRFPYGRQYGWCVTHRKGKKLICDVFAEAEAFTVMLRLSDAQYRSVYAGLQAYTRECIDGRYPCGDGGWIHYRVTDAAHLADAQTLLAVKCGVDAAGSDVPQHTVIGTKEANS